MRKLNKEAKKILIENQRHFEREDGAKKVSYLKLMLWFNKLNRLARRYKCDLVAVPYEKRVDFSYKYTAEYSKASYFKPAFRPAAGLWKNPKEFFDLHKNSLPENWEIEKAALFICVPRFKDAKIQRRNFYKLIGPSTYCDYQIFKTSEVKSEKADKIR